jgi:hypothetical protein
VIEGDEQAVPAQRAGTGSAPWVQASAQALGLALGPLLGGILVAASGRGLGTALGVAATTLILHLEAGTHDQLRPVALALAAAAACGAVLSIHRPAASGAWRAPRGRAWDSR